MVKSMLEMEKGIVLFDGECNFCDATVQFIIKHDTNDLIRFASQQSEIGMKLLIENGCIDNSLDTIFFLKNNNVYTKSEAIIEICKLLPGYPRVVVLTKIIPKKIRDYFYDKFSKNRYNLFGKKNDCIIPTIEIRNKFLN
jgi:predicted DCC family thiol-disulfide oxidoreductase YuxK